MNIVTVYNIYLLCMIYVKHAATERKLAVAWVSPGNLSTR